MISTSTTRSTTSIARRGLTAAAMIGALSAIGATAPPASAQGVEAAIGLAAPHAAAETVARSSCVIRGNAFSVDEHETAPDSHGRRIADIDFYAPGGTVTLSVTDRGGLFHQQFGTTITPILPGWHHLARFYRRSVGTPVAYRFTWTSSFSGGPGSCGNSFCGPSSFGIGQDGPPARLPDGTVHPMGGC